MKLSKLITIVVAIAAIMTVGATLGMAATIRIAIVPFQINAEKDYTFLQKGIVQMLTSRLSSDEVAVVDPIPTEKALQSIEGMSGDSRALMAGAKLQADYVIFGSITVLGESVSIDSKMLNVTGTREPLHFFKQTPSMNDVIPQINLLATEVNDKVFGRQAPTVAVAKPQASATPQGLPPSDTRAHPEKLLQGGITAEGRSGIGQPQSNPLNPAFIQTQGMGSGGGAGFWKSRNYNYIINGLSVGDVNNDGIEEVVLVSPDEVIIYQVAQNRMKKLAAIKRPKFTVNLSVDIGDINDNGTAEIFVTAYTNQRNAMASYVLEFDGKQFKTIVPKARWYFRIVEHPHRGQLLLGQQQRSAAPPNAAPIMEMAWKGQEYLGVSKLLPGQKVNLLGLAIGEISDKASDQAVGLTEFDRLRVVELNGKVAWTSMDYYGGTPNYLALPPDSPGDTYVSSFLPVRVNVVDLDNDGKQEILVPQNLDSIKRKSAEHRFFKKSKIVALSWDGLGLVPNWQTRTLSGRIQDIAVADFDNDGNLEMVAAVVSRESTAISKAKSSLIAFELKKHEDQQ